MSGARVQDAADDMCMQGCGRLGEVSIVTFSQWIHWMCREHAVQHCDPLLTVGGYSGTEHR